MSQKIAIVGAGLVGGAWAIVFARAGRDVTIFDPVDGAAEQAVARIAAGLPDLAAHDLLKGETADAVAARITTAESLDAALAGADHVQESAPERSGVKQALYQDLDRIAAPETILASSTSGIRPSIFSEGLDGRHRVLVAHPINPPHLVPLVELVPAPWTEPAAVDRTHELMTAVGQAPIRLTREVEGFIANRLQGAVLSEAFRLVEDGVCNGTDIDIAIAEGIGLRWAFLGPFATIDLNAPNGLKDYCERLSPLYYALAQEQADPREWGAALVDRLHAEQRAGLPLDQIPARSQWRDRRLMELAVWKAKIDD